MSDSYLECDHCESTEFVLVKSGRLLSFDFRSVEEAEAFAGGWFIANGWAVENLAGRDLEEGEGPDRNDRLATLAAENAELRASLDSLGQRIAETSYAMGIEETCAPVERVSAMAVVYGDMKRSRDGMSEVAGKQRTEIVRLAKENAELRARVHEMHRRAQRLEGIEESLAGRKMQIEEARAAAKRDRDKRVARARYIARFRQRLYREAAAMIVAAGVPDHVDGHEGDPRWHQGRLDVLIPRLVAQRDAARAEHAALVTAVRALIAELPLCDTPNCYETATWRYETTFYCDAHAYGESTPVIDGAVVKAVTAALPQPTKDDVAAWGEKFNAAADRRCDRASPGEDGSRRLCHEYGAHTLHRAGAMSWDDDGNVTWRGAAPSEGEEKR